MISVLVVDDSALVRRLVTAVLDEADGIHVVGTAANGEIALRKVDELKPDLVTLDIEMPVMDGLQTLEQLRELYPKLPVIMFSTLTERGASSTLDALERGARDYVTKPANVGSVTASMDAVRAQLVPKIVSLCHRPDLPGTPALPSQPRRSAAAGPLPGPRQGAAAVLRDPGQRIDVLTIGVSTGGPDALTTVLSGLPGDLEVPVLVVQHMPPVFTKHFAERLDSRCALSVSEARAGDPVEPGRVLLAPGDFHMRLHRAGERTVVSLDQGTREHYCRPSVDVLFRSVVEGYGAHVLALVLTGMGSDGASACGDVVDAGGTVFVQDERTSVVWGMPGAVAGAGLAHRILPVADIASAVSGRVRSGLPGPRRRTIVSEVHR